MLHTNVTDLSIYKPDVVNAKLRWSHIIPILKEAEPGTLHTTGLDIRNNYSNVMKILQRHGLKDQFEILPHDPERTGVPELALLRK